MKPLKLIIEGINSFTDAQELDFEAVGRSNLFCICGKTGAGKTTIFDSIMLALYGKSGKGNLADTVNLSRKSGTVVFEFEAGGDKYRVERTIKCRDEKNENGEATGRRLAMSADCMLYKNGSPQAKGSDDVSARIEALVGLAEGEFKNVYLLEQGEYAEFLKKPPAKQLETVGKIFSLMRFGDVHKLANEKMKEADALKAATEGRIADQGDITADGVRAAKSELAAFKTKRKALSLDIETRKKELEELGALRDLYLAALEKQKAVAEHAKRLDEARERLKTATAADEAFKATDTSAELEAKLKDLREKDNSLSALNALDRECEIAIADCEKKRADLDKKRETVANLDTELKRKEQAADADRQAFDVEIEAFKKAATRISNPSDALSRAVGTLENNATANTVTSCYYELCAEKNKYDELMKNAQSALGLADKLDKNAEDELKKTEALVEDQKRAEAQAEEARQAEIKAEEELSAAYLASHAAAISAELHDGDVCPVCGGTYHGGAHDGADVEAKKKEKDEAESARKKAEAHVVEQEKLVERSKLDYGRISREAEENREKAKDFEKQATATGVVPDVYNEMTAALERAKSSGEKKEKSAAECSEYAPRLAAARAELESAERAIGEAEQKAKELEERLGELRGRTGAEIEEVKA
ncbi:MAG: SMC family ATPase, partial [Clostridiales bacterium]|nr:SMC family ATPase [Clostridiales bacterium]